MKLLYITFLMFLAIPTIAKAIEATGTISVQIIQRPENIDDEIYQLFQKYNFQMSQYKACVVSKDCNNDEMTEYLTTAREFLLTIRILEDLRDSEWKKN